MRKSMDPAIGVIVLFLNIPLSTIMFSKSEKPNHSEIFSAFQQSQGTLPCILLLIVVTGHHTYAHSLYVLPCPNNFPFNFFISIFLSFILHNTQVFLFVRYHEPLAKHDMQVIFFIILFSSIMYKFIVIWHYRRFQWSVLDLINYSAIWRWFYKKCFHWHVIRFNGII